MFTFCIFCGYEQNQKWDFLPRFCPDSDSILQVRFIWSLRRLTCMQFSAWINSKRISKIPHWAYIKHTRHFIHTEQVRHRRQWFIHFYFTSNFFPLLSYFIETTFFKNDYIPHISHYTFLSMVRLQIIKRQRTRARGFSIFLQTLQKKHYREKPLELCVRS